MLMHNTNRRTMERYRIAGSATLISAEERIRGHIFDLSMNGLGFLIDEPVPEAVTTGSSWLCLIESKDLPRPIECFIKIVRLRCWSGGSEVGCVILMIDQSSKRCLKAFRGLAKSRSWSVKRMGRMAAASL